MNLEDYFTSLAYLGNEKTVIICDRGVMDLQFFGPPENWEEILAENAVLVPLAEQRVLGRRDREEALLRVAQGERHLHPLVVFTGVVGIADQLLKAGQLGAG